MNDVVKFDYSDYSVETTEILEGIEQAVKSRTAQTVIDNGRDLIRAKRHLKEVYGHGHFLKWVEQVLPWSYATVNNFMRVAETFKTPTVGLLNIQDKALYILSQNNVSEKIRDEAIKQAESGEKITHAKAKELIDAEKKIALLEEQLKEKPSVLIPGLQRLLDTGDITQRMAHIYAKLPEEQQYEIESSEEAKQTMEHNIQGLMNDKMYLLEEERKANNKADRLQDKFDLAVGEETSKLIAEKDLQIKRVEREKRLLREKIADDIRREVERDLSDRIKKAEGKASGKSEETAEYKRLLAKSNSCVHTLSSENDKLKEQIELNDPLNGDRILAKKIESQRKSFEYTMKYEIDGVINSEIVTDLTIQEFKKFRDLISEVISKIEGNEILEVTYNE